MEGHVVMHPMEAFCHVALFPCCCQCHCYLHGIMMCMSFRLDAILLIHIPEGRWYHKIMMVIRGNGQIIFTETQLLWKEMLRPPFTWCYYKCWFTGDFMWMHPLFINVILGCCEDDDSNLSCTHAKNHYHKFLEPISQFQVVSNSKTWTWNLPWSSNWGCWQNDDPFKSDIIS